MHAFDWPEQTPKIYMQYSMYQWLAQCCADKPTWGHIPQLFATLHLSLEKGI